MTKAAKEHIIASLSKGIRFDGRKLDELREITVELGFSVSAEGSARVKMGATEVIAGVKMGIEKPYPDTADQGNLMVNAELTPLSSPEFEPGPPSIESIELARVVDRGIRESHSIDLKKLCIKEGEKVWTVMIDVCTINADGNLIDAAALAALAAIKNARFPKFDGEKVDYEEHTDNKVPMESSPVAVTVFKIDKHLIVDPTPEEEKSADARLTITTIEDGSFCSLQKGGDSPLSIEEIDQMIGIAVEKADEMRQKVGE